jgi:hypothetical protein
MPNMYSDYGSLMHYGSMAFNTNDNSDAPNVLTAIDIINGEKVPNTANTNAMGQRKMLSMTDAIELVSDGELVCHDLIVKFKLLPCPMCELGFDTLFNSSGDNEKKLM